MEAKDTVKNPFLSAAEQAEISFKEGRESLLSEGVVAEALRRERQAGRLEVVEWFIQHGYTTGVGMNVSLGEWQAFLKEKGIK